MITLSYYPGCSLKSSGKFYDVSLKNILASFGINLKEMDDWSCCGASAACAVNEDLPIALSARNIALAEKTGFHLVAPCSACYARTKTAILKMSEDNSTRKRINNIIYPLECRADIEVKNIIEVFLEYIGLPRIAEAAIHGLTEIRAAAYWGCLLTRNQGIKPSDDIEDPVGMDLILRALGVTVIPWQYKTECCGGGATLTNGKKTAGLSGRLIQAAIRAGANAIVTTCPLCQINLDLIVHLDKDAAALPVFFLPEIFELALNGRIIGNSRHITETKGIERLVIPHETKNPLNRETLDEVNTRRQTTLEFIRSQDLGAADLLERLLVKQTELITRNVYRERFTNRQFSLVCDPLLNQAAERSRILERLGLGPATVPQLSRVLGLGPNIVFDHIKELARRDRVEIAGYDDRDVLYRRKST